MSFNFSNVGGNSQQVTTGTDNYLKRSSDNEVIAETNTSTLLQQVSSVKELKQRELQGESVSVGTEQLVKMVEKAMKEIQGPETSLDISIHKQTNQIMAKVINKENGEVIREIPPEKILDLVASMMKKTGIFVNERR